MIYSTLCKKNNNVFLHTKIILGQASSILAEKTCLRLWYHVFLRQLTCRSEIAFGQTNGEFRTGKVAYSLSTRALSTVCQLLHKKIPTRLRKITTYGCSPQTTPYKLTCLFSKLSICFYHTTQSLHNASCKRMTTTPAHTSYLIHKSGFNFFLFLHLSIDRKILPVWCPIIFVVENAKAEIICFYHKDIDILEFIIFEYLLSFAYL